jgi:hypothetical protein
MLFGIKTSVPFSPERLPNLQLWLDAQRIGVQGYSLDFDGTNDYVEADNEITSYPFTLECWVRLNVTNAGQRILAISNTTTGNVRYSLFYFQTDGKFYIQIQNTTTFSAGSTTTASANTWYHLAAVFESDTSRKLYINGVLEATGTDNVTFNNSADNKVNMGRHFTSSLFLNGKLSDVRIWNTARTAQQIADNYNKRLIGNESGLVGYWKLDKGTGTTVTDFTSNANAGTISGAVWDNAEPFTEPITDGTAVRLWADASGNGYNATQSTTAARPTYVANGLNGLPVVRFDGTDDRMATTQAGIINGSNATVFVIFNTNKTTPSDDIVFSAPAANPSAGGRGFDFRINPTTLALAINAAGTATSATKTITVNDSVFRMITGFFDASLASLEQKLFINGKIEAETTNAGASLTAASPFTLGAFTSAGSSFGSFLQGDIAEIIVYNRAVNTSELSLVHKYLSRKWGITLA